MAEKVALEKALDSEMHTMNSVVGEIAKAEKMKEYEDANENSEPFVPNGMPVQE